MKKIITHISNEVISNEWDQLANIRLQQLEKGQDLSMDHVIIPLIDKMTKNANFQNVIDLGCGTGYLTNKIAKKSVKISAIDISEKSIDTAKNHYERSKINFEKCAIEDYKTKELFTLGIANMTLMDVLNLENVIENIYKILLPNSDLVITITHPYFWPFYWNYYKEDWFDYSKELQIQHQFKTSLTDAKFKTTHFHRPLDFYLKILIKNHFKIIDFEEPMPTEEIMSKYPENWKFPRFLGIKCKKTLPNIG